jgi:hypothetical protein
MNKIKSKVNKLCGILTVFVTLCYILLSFMGTDIAVASPIQLLARVEEGAGGFGITQDEIRKKSAKNIIDSIMPFFGGNVSPAPTIPSNPNYLDTPVGLSSELTNILPEGDVPAGYCQDNLRSAMQILWANPQNIEVYKQASQKTNTPWEVLASIHYIEASFRPEGSLISGRRIGEPEPDRGGKVYSSLLESAIDAGQIFKDKKDIVDFVNTKNGRPPSTGLELLAGQLASYNAPTQSECEMGKNPAGGYDFIYTGRTWPGIPDKGQCSQNGVKGERFVGDRHVYATNCLDRDHTDMYHHRHFGGTVTKYTSHVGTLALIRAIRKDFLSRQETEGPKNLVLTPPNQAPPSGKLTYFYQCDPAFQKEEFGYCERLSRSTGKIVRIPIACNMGCGPTSAAEIISSYANGSYTPIHSVSRLISTGELDCGGAHISSLQKLFNDYPDKIEQGSWIQSSGDIYEDAKNMRNFTLNGWTLLGAASYEPLFKHIVWVVDVDQNGNIWANDTYFSQTNITGGSPVPTNLTGLMNGMYPYKDVTNINFSGFLPVRKK